MQGFVTNFSWFLIFSLMFSANAKALDWNCTRETKQSTDVQTFLDEIAGTKRRTARIVVENKSDQPITNIFVRHKYSDEFKDNCNWNAEVKSGSKTEKPMEVYYYTGWLTTGTDWWIISWADQSGGTYITSPKNYREAVDQLELIGRELIVKTGPAILLGAGISGLPADSAGASVDFIANTILNVESTYDKKIGVGFKQKVLTSEDSDATVEIVIGKLSGESGVLQIRRRERDGQLLAPENVAYKKITAQDRAISEKAELALLEEARKWSQKRIEELKKRTEKNGE